MCQTRSRPLSRWRVTGGRSFCSARLEGSTAATRRTCCTGFHSRGIRLIGALEWLLPLDSGPWQARWSLQEDYATLFDLLRRGQLKMTGLITHVVPTAQSQEIYSRLADREPGIGAVLFDWRTGEAQ